MTLSERVSDDQNQYKNLASGMASVFINLLKNCLQSDQSD